MPKVSDVFQSNYLQADTDILDFEDGGTVLRIKDGTIETFKNNGKEEDKIVLSFHGTDKRLVVNKTNANTLTDLFKSDDTDDWLDRLVKLYAKDVEYQGTMTRGIRIMTRLPKDDKQSPPAREKAAAAAPAAPRTDFDETADDEPRESAEV
jgi:hypothetical protein